MPMVSKVFVPPDALDKVIVEDVPESVKASSTILRLSAVPAKAASVKLRAADASATEESVNDGIELRFVTVRFEPAAESESVIDRMPVEEDALNIEPLVPPAVKTRFSTLVKVGLTVAPFAMVAVRVSVPAPPIKVSDEPITATPVDVNEPSKRSLPEVPLKLSKPVVSVKVEPAATLLLDTLAATFETNAAAVDAEVTVEICARAAAAAVPPWDKAALAVPSFVN